MGKGSKQSNAFINRRIKRAWRNRVNFVSPTISPAPKMDGVIESVQAAVEYYADHGIYNLIAQPKYMGSYCDMYLAKDIEDSFFISRNGYLIARNDPEFKAQLIEAAAPVHDLVYKAPQIASEMIVVQAELCPWGVLGKDGINKDYHRYLKIWEDQNLLVDTEFTGVLKMLSEDEKFWTGTKEHEKRNIKLMEGLIQSKWLDSQTRYAGLQKFKEQLNLYDNDNYINFKPFNILKWCGKDGLEVINQYHGTFQLFSSRYEIINNPSDWMEFQKLFDILHKQGVEGIVIKPVRYPNVDVAPMLKVRNTDYLTLIYGWDFDYRYEQHLEKRRVDKKMRSSLNDWKLGQALLRIPFQALQENQVDKYFEKYDKIYYRKVQQWAYQEELDPRL